MPVFAFERMAGVEVDAIKGGRVGEESSESAGPDAMSGRKGTSLCDWPDVRRASRLALRFSAR
jgi:hypothetical protein